MDGFGMAQLRDDVYRLARGKMLTTLPVWGTELLIVRVPQSVTYKHSAYQQLAASTSTTDIIRKTPVVIPSHDPNVTFSFTFIH
jgi:hypothetical protein